MKYLIDNKLVIDDNYYGREERDVSAIRDW